MNGNSHPPKSEHSPCYETVRGYIGAFQSCGTQTPWNCACSVNFALTRVALAAAIPAATESARTDHPAPMTDMDSDAATPRPAHMCGDVDVRNHAMSKRWPWPVSM